MKVVKPDECTTGYKKKKKKKLHLSLLRVTVAEHLKTHFKSIS